jgi:hypothetical protein
MGARLGFADVLLSKLSGAQPPVGPIRHEPRIASPSWLHRLDPLPVVSAPLLRQRYPQPVAVPPPASPVAPAPEQAHVTRAATGPDSGSSRQGCSRHPLHASPAAARTQRERLAIQLLNRLGAGLTPAATDEEVRSAYRQLVREAHPDRHPQADALAREGHTRRLRAVLRAWDLFQARVAA